MHLTDLSGSVVLDPARSRAAGRKHEAGTGSSPMPRRRGMAGVSTSERVTMAGPAPLGNPELAAREIERRAEDPRFVQVLMLAMGEQPLGKRHHWPIFAAAAQHGLPIGVHAGSLYHHPPLAAGYGSYFLEDYVGQAF